MLPPLFAHLDNPDGTRESICLVCYQVLMSAPNATDAEQQALEATHDCDTEWKRTPHAAHAA